MKTCPNCKHQNPDEAKFCGKCGKPLLVEQETRTYSKPDSSFATGAPRETVSQGLNIAIILVTLVVPIVGIIMGIIYMNDSNPAKKSAGKTWLWVGVGAGVFWCIFSLATSGSF